MLIHAMIRWPDIITETLWPFALRLLVDIHKATPNTAGFTPEEIFTGTKSTLHLHTFHPFGCPIFVLEPSLRQGHKIPKWKPRSRVGVYLGMSPDHASSVPLVLSTTTGLVSPQFHVIFDDHFSTTSSLHTNTIPPHWSTLLNDSSMSFIDEDFKNTNFYKSKWNPSHSTTSSTPTITPTQINLQHSSIDTSLLQREPFFNSSSTSTDTSITPPTTNLHESSTTQEILPPSTTQLYSGWNPNHRYDTRFKRQHTANFMASFQSPEIFNESSLTALLATQDLSPAIDSHTYHALQNIVTTPSSLTKDTLHYGEM
jgi:hypothetical protein